MGRQAPLRPLRLSRDDRPDRVAADPESGRWRFRFHHSQHTGLSYAGVAWWLALERGRYLPVRAKPDQLASTAGVISRHYGLAAVLRAILASAHNRLDRDIPLLRCRQKP